MRGKNLVDIAGQRFGRFLVKSRADSDSGGRAQWLCVCDCGSEVVVASYSLRKGNSKSCGCIQRDASESVAAVSDEESSSYRSWQGMKRRCFNKNSKDYPQYGGRGISVCKEWTHSFSAFLADMGTRPGPGYSLDRIDNEGDYSKDNCRWATRKQQARNKTTSREIEFQGRTQCLAQWCDELGLSYKAIYRRLTVSGWSIERAFTTPVRKQKRRFIEAGGQEQWRFV